MDSENTTIEIELNGITRSISVDMGTTLLDVLREGFGLKGTKKGCDKGQCGACTVLMDRIAVNSCLVLAVRAHKKKIMTIEGLDSFGRLNPIQEEFERYGAVQCGFCTPGTIMSTKALLDENPSSRESDVKEALSGHFCRCISHYHVVRAVLEAAKKES